MAKAVGNLRIKLDVDGIEGVMQLKSALTGLSKAAGPADNDLEKLAKEVKSFSRAGKESRDVVAGQVDALKKLRSQAGLGGKAFVNLTKDVIEYEKKLASADLQIEKTTAKFQTLRQVANQIPARRPDAFATQIASLSKELANASVAGEQYGQLLRQIQERTLSFQRAQARQGVIARAETGAKGPLDPRTAFTVSKDLPNTTAALSLKVSELKDNLQNLDFTSDKYSDTQREILSVEKQLEQIANKRIVAIKGVTDQQRRAEQMTERSRGRKQRLLANQSQTMAQDAASLAARRTLPGPPVREISGLYQSIGNVGMSKISADIDRMGKSYGEVANDIRRATLASNGSIRSLEAQRNSWASLRAGLDPASKGYRKIGREIDRVDKKLSKLSKTSRFTKGQLVQGAGAIASSAIFGGPLGALGGILGFAVGGPAGAAIGGGVGASANILVDYGRQIAELNTQLNLSKQTLALAANGQEDYNKLLGIARNISKDYAVGLKETLKGFSQVAVAARANNLTLQETETIYRGLVSSGIAFGKSQQDIDAIVRATVQVLSKGKLSAEELQGQIGERLPGAVAKFAEATGRTLPQLAKDLKAGTVQISDFVDFSKKQLFDYDKVAQLIADGPEKAGARLNLALEEAAENYGGFFQRVGAGFQDLFKGIVDFANDNVEVVKDMIADFIIAAEKIDLVFSDLAESIQSTLGPVLGGIVSMFGKGVETIYAGVMRERELQAGGFNAEQSLRRSEAAALNVTPNVLGLPGTQQFHPSYQGNVQQAYGVEMRYAQLAGAKSLREQGRGRVDESEERRQAIKDRFGFAPYSYGNYKTTKPPTGDDPQNLNGSGSGTDNTQSRIDSANEIVRKLMDQLAIAKEETEVGRFLAKQAKERSDQQAAFVKLQKDGEEVAITEAQTAAQGLLAKKQSLELQKRTNEAIEKATKPLEDITKNIHEKIRADKEYARLIAEGINPELAKQLVEINKQFLASRDLLDVQIEQAKASLSKLQSEKGTEEAIRAQIQAIKDLEDARKGLPGRKKEAEGAAGDAYKNPTIVEGLKTEISDLQKELDKLLDPVNQITGAANAIGTAFTNSFKSVIDGSATTQEALAGFFKNIGNYFLDMAMQIIQKMIEMAILNTIVGLLPGGGGGGGGGSKAPALALPGFAANGAYFDKGMAEFAKGGAFAKNKIVPYAKGGIVNKPTMFAYANGGSGRFGLMGEAGPEAIMPLRRGANGKLGVESSGGGVGNVVVNVDASGSKAEGDTNTGKQLGNLIGAAVKSELIKQQRPGGLLSR